MNRKQIHFLAIFIFFALVAVSQWGLVEQAAHMTAKQFAKGGMPRAKLLFEIGLFLGIITFTARVIPAKFNPRRDAVLILLGLIAGWCAEAWGTRFYLWRYYTGETPPLWIVPAWPLGILVIDRLSDHAATLLNKILPEKGFTILYWMLAALSTFVFLYFTQPVFAKPATVVLGAALAAAFLIKPHPKTAVPILLTGFVCVFFADFWGTTNHCWRYYIQHPGVPYGLWIGVAFGMTFDTAVVFLSWRLGNSLIERFLGPEGQRT